MLPNTGLTEKEVERKTLLVCGEDKRDVLSALDGMGVEYEPVKEFREFRAYRLAGGSEDMTLCITGLGSASVEILLTELFFCGARAFALAGTCGSLSPEFPVGTLVLASGAERHDGASFHYNADPGPAEADPEFLAIAENLLAGTGVAFKKGRMISTDTFYCMGARTGENGSPEYTGIPLKPEFHPPPAFSALKEIIEKKIPFAIDMETATFYALCSYMKEKVFNIAVKSVANMVPFAGGEQVENTRDALAGAVRAALCILEEID
ncbi:hypothetical protein ACFLQK_01025 [bacterium]